MLLLAIALMLVACGPSEQPSASDVSDLSPSEVATPPQSAENKQEVTLAEVDLEALQQLIDETAQRNQVLVIDFWATWCRPCVAMFGPLHEGLKKTGDQVRVVSVSMDAQETLPPAVKFLQEHGAMHDAFVLSPDSEQQERVVDALGERWSDLVVPAVLVYDQQGELAGEFLDGKVEPILEKVGSLINQDEDAARL